MAVREVNEKFIIGFFYSAWSGPVSGLSPEIQILRLSDFKLLDWINNNWISSVTAETKKIMSESTLIPAFYYIEFDHSIYDKDKEDKYLAYYHYNSTNDPINEIEIYETTNTGLTTDDIKKILIALKRDYRINEKIASREDWIYEYYINRKKSVNWIATRMRLPEAIIQKIINDEGLIQE